jgi:co-chaperonin GroES (HSP10)
MTKLNPSKERVLAEVHDEDEKKTAGGVILPSGTEKPKLVTATVLAIGSEVKEVKVGDIVLVPRVAGISVPDTKNKLYHAENDILAVVVGE